MAEIIPAVMPLSPDDIREHASQVEGDVRFIQLDIMDGLFVPERTWPYTRGGEEEFKRYASEADGLPFWDSLNYEVDLLVEDPATAADGWILAGVSRVIIHYESAPDVRDIIAALRDRFPKETDATIESVEVGVGFSLDTDLSDCADLIGLVDYVELMGIERIGFQGEPLSERIFSRILSLRELHGDVTIQIDGGVTLENAPLLLEAGASRLVSGSAVFASGDPSGAIRAFRAL